MSGTAHFRRNREQHASLSGERVFAQFLSIERQARSADTIEALAYCIVNDSQSLFGFRHAALVINGTVRAVTGVTQPAPHAPFVAFIERANGQLQRQPQHNQCAVVDATALDQQSRNDWLALSAPEALWAPLERSPGGAYLAVSGMREQPGNRPNYCWRSSWRTPLAGWHWSHSRSGDVLAGAGSWRYPACCWSGACLFPYTSPCWRQRSDPA